MPAQKYLNVPLTERYLRQTRNAAVFVAAVIAVLVLITIIFGALLVNDVNQVSNLLSNVGSSVP